MKNLMIKLSFLSIAFIGCKKNIQEHGINNKIEQPSSISNLADRPKNSFILKINGVDVTDSIINAVAQTNPESRYYRAGASLRINYFGSGNYSVSINDQLLYNMIIPLPGLTIHSWKKFLVHNNNPNDFVDLTNVPMPVNLPLIPGDTYHDHSILNYSTDFGAYIAELWTNIEIPITEPLPPFSNAKPLLRYYNSNSVDHFLSATWSTFRSGTPSYNWEGWEGNIFTSQVSGTTPLYRYYNASKTGHFYTINFSTLGNGAQGFAYEGIEGYVYSGNVSGSIPLYRYYNSSKSDHFYTTDFSELGNGSQGYVLEKIECYVLPAFADNLRPLHAYHRMMSYSGYTSPRSDNFYTTNFRKMGSNSNNYSFILYGPTIEYIYEGVMGKISSVQTGGMVPLYRYYNNNNDEPDHFYTITAGTYTDYYLENTEGYVWPTQQTGTVPLYRYHNPARGEHYYTTVFSEIGNGNSTFTYEGIECYIYPN